MSTIESVRDNNNEMHSIEVPQCLYCQLPVHGPEGHKSCIRQAKERELMASMEWRRKQELKIQQEQLAWEKNRPKSQVELDHEKFVKEQVAFEKQIKLAKRKQRLLQFQEEVEHLKKLIAEDEANLD